MKESERIPGNARQKSLLFYPDWYEMIAKLDDGMRLRVYDAVLRYAFEGIRPEDPMVAMATSLMFSAIDRDAKKYEKRCEKSRQAVLTRWEKERPNDDSTADIPSIRTNTNEYERIRTNTNEYERIRLIPIMIMIMIMIMIITLSL